MGQENQFLKEIATNYGFTGDTYNAFLSRFNPKNKGTINKDLSSKIPWRNKTNNEINKPQKLEEELDKIRKVLEENQCIFQNRGNRGRPPKGKSPWEQAFKWLWETKYPEWLQQQNIPISDEQAQKNAVCQFLEEVENRFQQIYSFHTPQPIILKDQYIPIQVTLERKYNHEVETTWSYAESEVEFKRVYALKGSEESQRNQVDWTEAKQKLKSKLIMVLADPGMGKTTLLRMEAYLTAKKEREEYQNNIKNLEEVVFPLFLRLSDIAKATNEVTAKLIDVIIGLIESKYDRHFPLIKSILENKLGTGKCLLLLDGLDEVPKENRNRNILSEKLNDFLRNYPCHIICTSRIFGYSGAFLGGMKEVEIVPFSQKQIDQYIEIWFNNKPEYLHNHSVLASSLIRELQNKPQIRGLTQNPLLLSLICSLYQQQDLTLPTRRCQIYEQAVRYMLSKWRQQRNSELNDGWIDAKTELLEELAYQFSCDNQEIFTMRELRIKIDKYKLIGKASTDFYNISPSSLITELSEEDGILQKPHKDSIDQYLFLHRTFQEYLTACYLNRSDRGIALAKDHFWDYEWHETLSLMAGMMKNPVPLIEAITNEKDDIFSTLLLLAGKCIAECEMINHHLIEHILDEIYQLWYRYQPIPFIQSVLVAVGNKYSQILEKLKSLLCDQNQNLRGDATENIKISLMKIYTRSKDLQLIRSASEILSKIGTEESVDVLISVLQHKDLLVRHYALSALGEIGTDKVINVLITHLKNNNSDVRQSAAEALGKIGTNQAVNDLIAALDDKCWCVRQSAAEALGQISNEKAVKPLILALIDSEPRVRSEAARALGEIGKKASVNALTLEELVDALIGELSKEELRIAEDVAFALSQIGTKKAIDALISALLKNQNSDIRIQVALAISNVKIDKIDDYLISALSDNNPYVRENVAIALGNVDTDKAINALISLLSNSDSQMRSEAAVALGKTGAERAIEALIKILNDEDSNVRSNAVWSLGEIGTETSVNALVSVLVDEDVNVRSNAAEALGKIGSAKAVDGLINALTDQSRRVRRDAAWSLGKICSQKAVDALVSVLGDKDGYVRANAAEALGKIGTREAIYVLFSTLSDNELYVRINAAWALNKIGSSEILRQLLKLHNIDICIYQPEVFLLARKLAVRFSKEKVDFIPVYPELLDTSFDN